MRKAIRFNRLPKRAFWRAHQAHPWEHTSDKTDINDENYWSELGMLKQNAYIQERKYYCELVWNEKQSEKIEKSGSYFICHSSKIMIDKIPEAADGYFQRSLETIFSSVLLNRFKHKQKEDFHCIARV